MRALSIRQPYAELILRGIKTAELRSRSTTIVGERFWIYASRSAGLSSGRVWSYDLSNTGGTPVPQWMIELAEQVKMIEPGTLLPTGVIVGSAVIEKVVRIENRESRIESSADSLRSSTFDPRSTMYEWHLTNVE